MQYFAGTGLATPKYQTRNANLPGWLNTQAGIREGIKAGDVEIFGTSWMRDLMVAKQFASPELVKRSSLFNGTIDANHQYTPKGHASHDLGMAMDLGVSNYITAFNQSRQGENVTAIVINQPELGWSIERAVALSALLTQNQGANQRAAAQDFLSIYWATKETIKRRDAQGNQTQEWVIANGANEQEKLKIQNLLFRGTNLAGTADASVSSIKTLYFGAVHSRLVKGGPLLDMNRYPKVNAVHGALGITSNNSQDHQNHFHFNLRPPAPELLEARNLVAETIGNSRPGVASQLSTDFLNESGSHFDESGQLVSNSQRVKADRELKLCRPYKGEFPIIEPGWDAASLYLKLPPNLEPQHPEWKKAWNAIKILSITLVDKPIFGSYKVETKNAENAFGGSYITYIPPSDTFYGKDQLSFLVKLSNGKSVLTRYQMEPSYDDSTYKFDKCVFKTKSGLTQLSLNQIDELNSDYTAWQRSAQLSAVIASAQQTLTGFTDLPSTALGQTTGEGASAQITLDQNAAGHGWYTDPTPLDNTDDFLPTSAALTCLTCRVSRPARQST